MMSRTSFSRDSSTLPVMILGKIEATQGGEGARSNWRNKFGKKTRPVRDYRNHLVHGRLTPSIGGFFPKIGREMKYFDWRKVTDPQKQASIDSADFKHPREILVSAWKTTLTYLREMWDQHLLAPKGP